MRETVRDAGRDLLLGGACVGCGRPGRVLCPGCEATLPRRGRVAWPTPAPPGLAVPYAAGVYDGLLKTLVNEHKEHTALDLARPLGGVLAEVVHDLLREVSPAPAGVVLVPVPSRRPVVRRRGHDPLLRITRAAADRLRSHGVPASVGRLLLACAPVRDQAGLGVEDRASNLAGSLRARRGRSVRAAAGAVVVVVVDDVLTTGATAREAQRALEGAGTPVTGVAVVAATRRLLPPRPTAMGVPYRSARDTTTVCPWSPSGSVVASPDWHAGPPECEPVD